MAVNTPDAVTFAGFSVDVSGTAATLEHTVTEGTSLVLLIVGAKASEPPGATSVTWNTGQTMDPVANLDGGSGSSAAAEAAVFGLVDPVPATANFVINSGVANLDDASWFAAINFTGTSTSSVASAIQLLSEAADTDGTTNTSIHASGGTAGNALLFVGCGVGDDMITGISNNAGFTQILADNTGGGAGNDFDLSAYIAELLDAAPSAITVTWNETDEHASGLFEIAAAAEGVVNTSITIPTGPLR